MPIVLYNLYIIVEDIYTDQEKEIVKDIYVDSHISSYKSNGKLNPDKSKCNSQ